MKIKDYFKIPRMSTSNKHNKEARPGHNKYLPHQGKKEITRRQARLTMHGKTK